jgi:hypothetical protein
MKENKKTALVCTVMSHSPPQSPENLGFGILTARCVHTASVLELQKEPKCSFATYANEG